MWKIGIEAIKEYEKIKEIWERWREKTSNGRLWAISDCKVNHSFPLYKKSPYFFLHHLQTMLYNAHEDSKPQRIFSILSNNFISNNKYIKWQYQQHNTVFFKMLSGYLCCLQKNRVSLLSTNYQQFTINFKINSWLIRGNSCQNQIKYSKIF